MHQNQNHNNIKTKQLIFFTIRLIRELINMNENQSSNSQGSGTSNVNEAVSSPASTANTSKCCEFFVDTLNSKAATRTFLIVNSTFDSATMTNSVFAQARMAAPTNHQEFIINNELTNNDVDAFLTYCQVWQQKYKPIKRKRRY